MRTKEPLAFHLSSSLNQRFSENLCDTSQASGDGSKLRLAHGSENEGTNGATHDHVIHS